jgi:hypothetical protein
MRITRRAQSGKFRSLSQSRNSIQIQARADGDGASEPVVVDVVDLQCARVAVAQCCSLRRRILLSGRCRVSARPREAGHYAGADRVGHVHEYNWDVRVFACNALTSGVVPAKMTSGFSATISCVN